MPAPRPESGGSTTTSYSSKTLLSLLLIAVAVFVCYGNTLDNDFVHDDRVEILQNPLIKDSSNLWRILTSPAWSFLRDTGEAMGSNYYRPVQYLTYFGLFHFFGTAPFGYHLFKLFLHLGVCLLFFRIGHRFLVGLGGALASSLIFAVHPINTEAVSWISGITDVTCALFFLLSFYFFLSDDERPSQGKIICLYFCFFVGMFSKETMATFVPALVIYQWLLGKLPSRRQVVRIYLPLLLLLLVYLAVRVSVIGSFTSADQIRYDSLGWFQSVLNQVVLLSEYFRTAILPLHLNAYHVFDPVLSLSDLRFWSAVLILVCVFVCSVYISRRLEPRQKAILIFGVLLFIVVLSPVLIFFKRVGENVFAERYLYLPTTGLVLSLVAPLARIKLKPQGGTAFLVLLILFSWGTIRRNGIWQNEVMFYETTARDSSAASIWNNLGTAYGSAGRSEDALKAFETSVALRPNAEAFANLGRIYSSLRRFSEAENAYLRAIEVKPRNANHYSGLGDLYFAQGRYNEAIPRYKRCLEINPHNVRAAFNLADACRMEKRYDEAIEACRQVASLGPQQAMRAYRTMAGIYTEQGLRKEAAEANRLSEAIIHPR
jgi:Flp pilus assembly protein TadD